VETELKLRIPQAALERVRVHPLLATAGPQPVHDLDAVYYDTPDCSLRRAGAALRVRREGGRWVQTVKWSGSARAALHERNEIEMELQGPAPDCTKFVHPDIAALFRAVHVARTLRPVFETRITRSTRILTTADGSIVEASLDEGEIRSGDRAEPVCELELELKEGQVSSLFGVALELTAAAPLYLENRSKAGRGYALVRGEPAAPTRAGSPVLDADMSVSAAFAAIAWSTLTHLQANEQGAIEGKDPEFLHQMRVALRRLRSALSVFADALPSAARQPIVADLRWLSAALGPARDWDVFVTETFPPLRLTFGDRPGIAALAAEARRRQTAARRTMKAAVRSRRYQRVLIGLGSWLATHAWRERAGDGARAVLDGAVRSYAQSELEARYERVRKRGRKGARLSAPELHQLRIAIKKLRYALDFFGSLFDAEAVRRLRSRLSRLQDVLGTINDAATMQHLIAQGYADGRSAGVAEARGILLGWSEGRACALRAELDRAWKAFRRSETFW